MCAKFLEPTPTMKKHTKHGKIKLALLTNWVNNVYVVKLANGMDWNDIMNSGKELSTQEILERVKFRMEVLGMIEDKLRQMKALAERAAESELGQDEIVNIQGRINELMGEIAALDKVQWVDETIH